MSLKKTQAPFNFAKSNKGAHSIFIFRSIRFVRTKSSNSFDYNTKNFQNYWEN